jgi:RNA polymerase-interacting CarD/CdnL/TRCF family regulator
MANLDIRLEGCNLSLPSHAYDDSGELKSDYPFPPYYVLNLILNNTPLHVTVISSEEVKNSLESYLENSLKIKSSDKLNMALVVLELKKYNTEKPSSVNDASIFAILKNLLHTIIDNKIERINYEYIGNNYKESQ